MTKQRITAEVVAATTRRTRRLIRRVARVDESDPDAPHAVQVDGVGRRFAELAAQPGQVDIDGAPAPPYACRHTSARMSRLVTTWPLCCASRWSRSNSLRDRSRISSPRLATRVPALIVKAPTTIGPSAATAWVRRRNRAHPGVELVTAEGLDDIVVGPGVQRPDGDPVVVAGGNDDDGHAAHGPKHAEHLEPVDIGQAQVEDHEVGPVVDGLLQSAQPGLRTGHRVASVRKGTDQGRPDAGVVFDNEDRGHASYRSPPPVLQVSGPDFPAGSRGSLRKA